MFVYVDLGIILKKKSDVQTISESFIGASIPACFSMSSKP